MFSFQLLNAVLFFIDALNFFIPHIAIIFALILFEGLLGGAAYVNTFHGIHRSVRSIIALFIICTCVQYIGAGFVLCAPYAINVAIACVFVPCELTKFS